MEKKKIPSEHMEQVHFVSWFRKTFPGVLIFAIPNGGSRHIATAVKLKAEGVTPGVPDLYIPRWRLWVEMKRQNGGKLSLSQDNVIDYLSADCGDSVIVGIGFEDAKGQVLEWKKSYQLS